MRAFLLALAAGLVGATAAAAQPTPSCQVPPGVQPIAVPRGVPAMVMAGFRRQVPLFAMPGQPFEVGDAIGPDSPRYGRRLNFVWRRGERWAFAWEQGGIAHFGVVSVYSADGRRLAEAQSQPNQQMCETAARLLTGRGDPTTPRVRKGKS